MSTPKQLRYDKLGPTVVQALQKRQFDAVYFSNADAAIAHFRSLLSREMLISFGGSQTLAELNIPEMLVQNGYRVLDRARAKTPEQREEIMRLALTCDTFLMSANAITQDGQLVNLDGNGNRLAPLLYGPRQVIVLAGMNKVVATAEDAIRRVRTIAAPENAQRFGLSTPCSKTGACADCLSPECICAQLLQTRFCRPAKRIRVILIGQDYGM